MIQALVTPVAIAQEGLYCVSLHATIAGEPHTIGKKLCLPLAKEMTRIMCG